MRYLSALATMLIGCSANPVSDTGKPMNLEEASARLAKLAGRPVRPFATTDFGREKNLAARSVIVTEVDAPRIVDELRREIGPGLIAFVGCTRSLANPPANGCEIVIAIGEDQFDTLRVAQSDAANYDMATEDLVRKLQTYNSKYGIDIFHAETDTIEFRLRSVPMDLPAFCKDLYEFCPDIVDQGVGTVEALEKEVAKSGKVYLWWD